MMWTTSQISPVLHDFAELDFNWVCGVNMESRSMINLHFYQKQVVNSSNNNENYKRLQLQPPIVIIDQLYLISLNNLFYSKMIFANSHFDRFQLPI